MAAVAVSAASPAHHYIRTIHTSFTAAHSNPWARSSAPLHANIPLYSSQTLPSHHHVHNPSAPLKYTAANNTAGHTTSGTGGRRRAYAFRAPSVTPPNSRQGSTYKFDPFADEPTTPVPTLSTLASLSVPPAPRLAPAALPQPQPRRAISPAYNHQLHQQTQAYHRRNGYHTRRQPNTTSGSTEIWRSIRPLACDIEEYDYETSSPSTFASNGNNNNGGRLLATPLTPRPTPAAATRASGPAVVARGRSPSPPSTLNPASPVFTPSRPLTRTPSPPTAAPPPSYAATRSSMLNDKDAKARLVAGILLNRVHLNKPTRRRPIFGDAKRAYVPSGLSRVVSVEA